MTVRDLAKIIETQKEKIVEYEKMINVLNVHEYAPEKLFEYHEKLKQENEKLRECVEVLRQYNLGQINEYGDSEDLLYIGRTIEETLKDLEHNQ